MGSGNSRNNFLSTPVNSCTVACLTILSIVFRFVKNLLSISLHNSSNLCFCPATRKMPSSLIHLVFNSFKIHWTICGTIELSVGLGMSRITSVDRFTPNTLPPFVLLLALRLKYLIWYWSKIVTNSTYIIGFKYWYSLSLSSSMEMPFEDTFWNNRGDLQYRAALRALYPLIVYLYL